MASLFRKARKPESDADKKPKEAPKPTSESEAPTGAGALGETTLSSPPPPIHTQGAPDSTSPGLPADTAVSAGPGSRRPSLGPGSLRPSPGPGSRAPSIGPGPRRPLGEGMGLYRVDNSRLQATTQGISYRRTTNMDDKAGEFANWGSIVRGTNIGDGWIRVDWENGDSLYLPVAVRGIPVLVPEEPAKPSVSPRTSPLYPQGTPGIARAPHTAGQAWPVKRFEHCVRALVHYAGDIPVPPAGGRATVTVALRLLHRDDGRVLHESRSTERPVIAAPAEVFFGEELVVPVWEGDQRQLIVQLTLDMVYNTGSAAATTTSLLDLHWNQEALPPLDPLHLYARPSQEGTRSYLLASLIHEPSHSSLEQLLGGSDMHAVEMRVHGVPANRPLPQAVQGGFLAICPDVRPTGAESAELHIPIATHYYDQRLDFTQFMESQFRIGAGLRQRYILTPLTGSSHAPQWSQFVMRFLASPSALTTLPIYLFQYRGASIDPGTPLSGGLQGFATLDARVLLAHSSEPLQRVFVVDLRLLEASRAPSALEFEVRVWPRRPAGGAPTVASPPELYRAPAPAPEADADADVLANRELSLQLAKEFNLRAAALKKAGEEIVSLRQQVQLLRDENARLKTRLSAEESAEQALRPPLEGLENLSSAELAQRLQQALDRYRDEKAKSADLSKRLQDAVKEAHKGREHQRAFDKLEQGHMEQNRELQRLQEESKKLEAYRQTTQTQEKVIAKLEKILESSLQEVQKAQRVQVDVEHLKTENLRLRDRCASLAARKKYEPGGDADAEERQQQNAEREDLRRKVAERDVEIARLEELIGKLQAGPSEELQQQLRREGAGPLEEELERERQRMTDVEAERYSWEQRCRAAESQNRIISEQLTESNRLFGQEISAVQVEVAKRDARIQELEFRLRNIINTGGALPASYVGLGTGGVPAQTGGPPGGGVGPLIGPDASGARPVPGAGTGRPIPGAGIHTVDPRIAETLPPPPPP